jgi:hypothetical protein
MLKETTSLMAIQKICVEFFIQIDQRLVHVNKVQSFVDVVPIFGNQMFGDSCCALSVTFFDIGATKVPL